MARVIQSPVKRFAGEVQLPDFLDFPSYLKWRDAIGDAQGYLNDLRAQAREAGQETFSLDQIEYNRRALPGIIAVVETWNIAGLKTPVTPDNFPVTPLRSAAALVNWLVGEITALFVEAEETDPNS